ncbi:MAG: nuclear transport factor 2 family protein [Bacteroidales bacterium]|nr:nuclear transport factor 2 family protein [Bacteroidales bacterium]
MTKTEIAIDFLKMLTSQRVDVAFEKYIHTDFIHHNMHFKGDRNSFLTAIKSGMQNVKTEFVVLRTLEENSLVAVHAKVKFDNAPNWIALVHFFRFEDEKIIEEWEVSNEVMNSIPNENGAF